MIKYLIHAKRSKTTDPSTNSTQVEDVYLAYDPNCGKYEASSLYGDIYHTRIVSRKTTTTSVEPVKMIWTTDYRDAAYFPNIDSAKATYYQQKDTINDGISISDLKITKFEMKDILSLLPVEVKEDYE